MTLAAALTALTDIGVMPVISLVATLSLAVFVYKRFKR